MEWHSPESIRNHSIRFLINRSLFSSPNSYPWMESLLSYAGTYLTRNAYDMAHASGAPVSFGQVLSSKKDYSSLFTSFGKNRFPINPDVEIALEALTEEASSYAPFSQSRSVFLAATLAAATREETELFTAQRSDLHTVRRLSDAARLFEHILRVKDDRIGYARVYIRQMPRDRRERVLKHLDELSLMAYSPLLNLASNQ